MEENGTESLFLRFRNAIVDISQCSTRCWDVPSEQEHWQGIRWMLYLPSMQKTKQPAIVPPSEKALEWLPEHPADCKADTKVFANAPTLSSANRALKHMARRADIRKTISFHVARHTFATMTLTAGGDLYTTSRLLGHTNIHSTEIYADVVMERRTQAVNLLNAIF